MRCSKKTNGEENELSPFLRLKGLSEGQIVNLHTDNPDLDLDRAEKVWAWIKKTKYFKNKPAVFYTALLEGWSLPSGNKKKDLPWL